MITLVFERHVASGADETFRTQLALASFPLALASCKNAIVPVWAPFKRSSKNIGDRRELPYLKDLLATGMEVDMPGTLLFVNSDIILLPAIVNLVRNIDTARSIRRIDVGGKRHIGRDAFAFNKKWLADRMTQIPDFIVGACRFDLWLASWIRLLNKNYRSTIDNLGLDIAGCEITEGPCLHITHAPTWSVPGYEKTSPANLHNVSLCNKNPVFSFK